MAFNVAQKAKKNAQIQLKSQESASAPKGAEKVPSAIRTCLVSSSTALLYPAFRNNNQTLGDLGRVCATGMNRSIQFS